MGAGYCEKHDLCFNVNACEHIASYIQARTEFSLSKQQDIVPEFSSATLTKNRLWNFLGISNIFLYCEACARKYWLPIRRISQARLLFFNWPFLRAFRKPSSRVCGLCCYEELFGLKVDIYSRAPLPFMNTTQTPSLEERHATFPALQKSEDAHQVTTYAKMKIALERGRGVWVWTSDGERYLDLYGGHAVCATGHCHPHVVQAIQEQSAKLLFYSNLVYAETRARAAEKLASVAPKSLTKAFFCNSGTEANENAMRMARMTTGREKIITFAGGFHGRTADSISATFLGKYRALGRPNVPHHVCAEWGDMASVRALADNETAGIMLEPIQSMAGVREAPPQFFRELREICDEHGMCLIFDEVQTGVGRTGNWFFGGSELAEIVEPDIITLAKSLGSGVPVGACLVNDRVAAHIKENDLGTTFGGGMLAMAAVLATLEAIEQDRMIANARRIENYLRERLPEIPQFIALHGKGCLLGIEFAGKASAVHAQLLQQKIITGTSSNPQVLRLLPPLNVSTSEIDLLIDALANGA